MLSITIYYYVKDDNIKMRSFTAIESVVLFTLEQAQQTKASLKSHHCPEINNITGHHNIADYKISKYYLIRCCTVSNY